MNNDYSLHVDLKEHSAKMLFPFIKASGDDAYLLGEQFYGNDSFVVKTYSKNVEVLLWWDFGSQIPDKVWGGFGIGDFIASIDKGYSDNLCKQAVFEYVKLRLIEQVFAKINEMANEFVGKNS